MKNSAFSSVQLLSFVWLFATLWTAACQASLSNTNSCSPPTLMSSEWVMPSNHLILCHPLLLLPSILPSITVFPSESVLCTRWPKYWSFSFSICPSNDYSDWFPLGWAGWIFLQSKGSQESSPHDSSKTSILRHSAFLILSNSHIHTWLLENHSFD